MIDFAVIMMAHECVYNVSTIIVSQLLLFVRLLLLQPLVDRLLLIEYHDHSNISTETIRKGV